MCGMISIARLHLAVVSQFVYRFVNDTFVALSEWESGQVQKIGKVVCHKDTIMRHCCAKFGACNIIYSRQTVHQIQICWIPWLRLPVRSKWIFQSFCSACCTNIWWTRFLWLLRFKCSRMPSYRLLSQNEFFKCVVLRATSIM